MSHSVKMDVELNEPVLNVAMDTIHKNKQALVFVNTKRSAEKVAEDIAKHVKDNNPLFEELAYDIESAVSPSTKQCKRLAKCISKGIAFHHAGLHQKQRELIEDNFRAGVVKIIACTPTLAAGLDMPAFRSIIRDLKRHGGNWGMVNIPVLEYHQMAGRAGRPGKDPYGEVITFAKTKDEEDDIRDEYLRGKPENIYSKLAVEPVLRTYVLSLIASGYVNTEQSLIEFFSKTFWAHQYKDMQKLSEIIRRMLDLLADYGFIYATSKKPVNASLGKIKDTGDLSDDAFLSAKELAQQDMITEKGSVEKIRATTLGKRVAELYLDPYTANHIITLMRRAVDIEITNTSLLQMISHTIEMRPLVKMRKKNEALVLEFLAKNESVLLEQEPSIYDIEYEDFNDSILTALFFEDWINEVNEEKLLETYNIRPGETRYKVDNADWLLYASSEFAKILDLKPVVSMLHKLSIRVKYGVREELLALLKFKNIGRARARRLYENNVRSVGDVKKMSQTSLSQIVGGKIAASLKEQVGDEVEEISPRKRKGQMSIDKFTK